MSLLFLAGHAIAAYTPHRRVHEVWVVVWTLSNLNDMFSWTDVFGA